MHPSLRRRSHRRHRQIDPLYANRTNVTGNCTHVPPRALLVGARSLRDPKHRSLGREAAEFERHHATDAAVRPLSPPHPSLYVLYLKRDLRSPVRPSIFIKRERQIGFQIWLRYACIRGHSGAAAATIHAPAPPPPPRRCRRHFLTHKRASAYQPSLLLHLFSWQWQWRNDQTHVVCLEKQQNTSYIIEKNNTFPTSFASCATPSALLHAYVPPLYLPASLPALLHKSHNPHVDCAGVGTAARRRKNERGVNLSSPAAPSNCPLLLLLFFGTRGFSWFVFVRPPTHLLTRHAR